jgi:hypothetical protein
MNATVLGEDGRRLAMLMGCYGIGVTRIVAAAIEQNHDERGIIWPDPIAPFHVVLALNVHKSPQVREAADALYARAMRRRHRGAVRRSGRAPGVKFADAELLGIPHRLVVGERGLEAGTLEYRHRRATASEDLPLAARWPSCARAWLADGCAALAPLALLGGGAWAADTAPPPQSDPQLRAVVQQAIDDTACFTDQYDSAVWYKLMEPKLRRYVSDEAERLRSCRRCIARPTGRRQRRCRPGLVLAVLDVESRFDRWAVSSAGAVGLMQVMPFWPERLGMRRYELVGVGQHPHGLRDPALLPAGRAQRRAQRAGALQRQRRPARLSGPRDRALDGLLEGRRRSGTPRRALADRESLRRICQRRRVLLNAHFADAGGGRTDGQPVGELPQRRQCPRPAPRPARRAGCARSRRGQVPVARCAAEAR